MRRGHAAGNVIGINYSCATRLKQLADSTFAAANAARQANAKRCLPRDHGFESIQKNQSSSTSKNIGRAYSHS
jgi:hypothetical protein